MGPFALCRLHLAPPPTSMHYRTWSSTTIRTNVALDTVHVTTTKSATYYMYTCTCLSFSLDYGGSSDGSWLSTAPRSSRSLQSDRYSSTGKGCGDTSAFIIGFFHLDRGGAKNCGAQMSQYILIIDTYNYNHSGREKVDRYPAARVVCA